MCIGDSESPYITKMLTGREVVSIFDIWNVRLIAKQWIGVGDIK
jgi:hypothetical protein